MTRVIAVLVGVGLLLGVLAAQRSSPGKMAHVSVAPAAGARSNALVARASVDAWIPANAAIVLDIARADDVLDLALDPELAGRINLPASKLPQGLVAFARYLEKQLDADWRTLVRRAVHGGLTIAVGPNKSFVAIAQAADAAFLQQAHEAITNVVRQDAKQKQQSNRFARADYAGVTYETISGGAEYHAIVGNCLILSNQLPLLKSVLDLRAASGEAGVAKLDGYQTAKRNARPNAAATLLVSPLVMQNLPFLKQQNNATPNPMAVLLFGGYQQTWRNTGWLALDASVENKTISLRLAPDQAAPVREGPMSFAWPPKAGDGALENIAVPRQIAAASLYRNLHDFYAAKDALFPERTSQLIFFENMMGIYFSGRDLTEDVMGALQPHIRLVVAEQDYDPQIGTPATRFPAFAVVFRMNDPAQYGIVAEEAWQKVLGMANFTRGQQALPGLIIDRREHGGVRYSCAAFSHAAERDKAKLDTRFNFSPSIAIVGEHLIFSSTGQLSDDLIDALRGGSARPVAGLNGVLEIDGPRLASILEANREIMIRQNMMKKGQDRATAEKEFAILPAIARALGHGTLRLGAPEGKVVADLSFDLKARGRMPATQQAKLDRR